MEELHESPVFQIGTQGENSEMIFVCGRCKQ